MPDPLPYITQVFPLGVRAGESASVAVTGVNLGDVHEVKVDPPKSVEGWTTMPLKVKSDGGWSLNTVKLAVGNDPEILEQEPNNSPAQAQTISLARHRQWTHLRRRRERRRGRRRLLPLSCPEG